MIILKIKKNDHYGAYIHEVCRNKLNEEIINNTTINDNNHYKN